jgi:hypothetical protein
VDWQLTQRDAAGTFLVQERIDEIEHILAVHAEDTAGASAGAVEAK